jgi:chloride channel, nucleotide-sensitive, 1A
VRSSALAFMPAVGDTGFTIPYPAITLHAISRTDTGPSIYCQLDDAYGAHPVNGAGADDDEVGELRELVIVPADPATRELRSARPLPPLTPRSRANLRGALALRGPAP